MLMLYFWEKNNVKWVAQSEFFTKVRYSLATSLDLDMSVHIESRSLMTERGGMPVCNQIKTIP